MIEKKRILKYTQAMLFRSSQQEIFLDYASGTPLDPDILKRMQPYWTDLFYNPGALYFSAKKIQELLFDCKERCAELLGVHADEIYFCDGATEANNIYIQGVIAAWQKAHPDKQARIIISAIEHSSIMKQVEFLEARGVQVDIAPVDEKGCVDLNFIKESLAENTVLVSVGYVNGEIGVIQDIPALAKLLRKYRKEKGSDYPYLHTDAVQAPLVLNIHQRELPCDALTLNAGKIYGPKKMGLLYMKRKTACLPLIYGGEQEAGLRPGTENIPGIVGLTEALERSFKGRVKESERLENIRAYFLKTIQEFFPEALLNGKGALCAPHIVNLSFPNVSSEELVLRLDAKGVMISEKSACQSGKDGDSHVIRALRDTNTKSLRFSFGRTTSIGQLTKALKILRSCLDNIYRTQKEFDV